MSTAVDAPHTMDMATPQDVADVNELTERVKQCEAEYEDLLRRLLAAQAAEKDVGKADEERMKAKKERASAEALLESSVKRLRAIDMECIELPELQLRVRQVIVRAVRTVVQHTDRFKYTQLIGALENLGSACYNCQDYRLAEESYDEMESVLLSNDDVSSPAYSHVCYMRGVLCMERDDYATASGYFVKAREMEVESHRQQRSEAVTLLSELGSTKFQRGDYPGAIACHREALDIASSTPGLSVVGAHNSLGCAYLSNGEFDAAKEQHEAALKILRSVGGRPSPDLAATAGHMGNVYFRKGDRREAEKWFANALRIQLAIFGKDHPLIATSYANLGAIYFEDGDFGRAKEQYAACLQVRKQMYGETRHPDMTLAYSDMGKVCSALGENMEAVDYFAKAVESHPEEDVDVFNEEVKLLPAGGGSIGIAMDMTDLATSLVLAGKLTDAVDAISIACEYLTDDLPTHLAVIVAKDILRTVLGVAGTSELCGDVRVKECGEVAARYLRRVISDDNQEAERIAADCSGDADSISEVAFAGHSDAVRLLGRYLDEVCDSPEGAAELFVNEAHAAVARGHENLGVSYFSFALGLFDRIANAHDDRKDCLLRLAQLARKGKRFAAARRLLVRAAAVEDSEDVKWMRHELDADDVLARHDYGEDVAVQLEYLRELHYQLQSELVHELGKKGDVPIANSVDSRNRAARIIVGLRNILDQIILHVANGIWSENERAQQTKSKKAQKGAKEQKKIYYSPFTSLKALEKSFQQCGLLPPAYFNAADMELGADPRKVLQQLVAHNVVAVVGGGSYEASISEGSNAEAMRKGKGKGKGNRSEEKFETTRLVDLLDVEFGPMCSSISDTLAKLGPLFVESQFMRELTKCIEEGRTPFVSMKRLVEDAYAELLSQQYLQESGRGKHTTCLHEDYFKDPLLKKVKLSIRNEHGEPTEEEYSSEYKEVIVKGLLNCAARANGKLAAVLDALKSKQQPGDGDCIVPLIGGDVRLKDASEWVKIHIASRCGNPSCSLGPAEFLAACKESGVSASHCKLKVGDIEYDEMIVKQGLMNELVRAGYCVPSDIAAAAYSLTTNDKLRKHISDRRLVLDADFDGYTRVLADWIHPRSLLDYPEVYHTIVESMPFSFYGAGKWEESWLDVLSDINNDCKHVRLTPQETKVHLRRKVGTLHDSTVSIDIEHACPEIRGWTFVEDMPRAWTDRDKLACSQSVTASLKTAGMVDMKKPNVNAVEVLSAYVGAYREWGRIERKSGHAEAKRAALAAVEDAESAVEAKVAVALSGLRCSLPPTVVVQIVGKITERLLKHTRRVKCIGLWPDRQVNLLKLLDRAFVGVERLASAVGREIGFGKPVISLPVCDVLVAPAHPDESENELRGVLDRAVARVNDIVSQRTQVPTPTQLHDLETSLQTTKRCYGLLHDRNCSANALQLRVAEWLWNCNSGGARHASVELLLRHGSTANDTIEVKAISFLASVCNDMRLHEAIARYLGIVNDAANASKHSGDGVTSALLSVRSQQSEYMSLFEGDPDIYAEWCDVHTLGHRLRVAAFNFQLHPNNGVGVDEINCLLADWVLRCRVVLDHCFWRCLLRTVYMPEGADLPSTVSLAKLLDKNELRPYFAPTPAHSARAEQLAEQQATRELLDRTLGMQDSPWKSYTADSWSIVTSDWYRLLVALNNRGKHAGLQRVFVYDETTEACAIVNLRDYDKKIAEDEWDLYDFLDTVEDAIDDYARVCAATRAAVYATGVEKVVFESGEMRLPSPSLGSDRMADGSGQTATPGGQDIADYRKVIDSQKEALDARRNAVSEKHRTAVATTHALSSSTKLKAKDLDGALNDALSACRAVPGDLPSRAIVGVAKTVMNVVLSIACSSDLNGDQRMRECGWFAAAMLRRTIADDNSEAEVGYINEVAFTGHSELVRLLARYLDDVEGSPVGAATLYREEADAAVARGHTILADSYLSSAVSYFNCVAHSHLDRVVCLLRRAEVNHQSKRYSQARELLFLASIIIETQEYKFSPGEQRTIQHNSMMRHLVPTYSLNFVQRYVSVLHFQLLRAKVEGKSMVERQLFGENAAIQLGYLRELHYEVQAELVHELGKANAVFSTESRNRAASLIVGLRNLLDQILHHVAKAIWEINASDPRDVYFSPFTSYKAMVNNLRLWGLLQGVQSASKIVIARADYGGLLGRLCDAGVLSTAGKGKNTTYTRTGVGVEEGWLVEVLDLADGPLCQGVTAVLGEFGDADFRKADFLRKLSVFERCQTTPFVSRDIVYEDALACLEPLGYLEVVELRGKPSVVVGDRYFEDLTLSHVELIDGFGQPYPAPYKAAVVDALKSHAANLDKDVLPATIEALREVRQAGDCEVPTFRFRGSELFNNTDARQWLRDCVLSDCGVVGCTLNATAFRDACAHSGSNEKPREFKAKSIDLSGVVAQGLFDELVSSGYVVVDGHGSSVTEDPNLLAHIGNECLELSVEFVGYQRILGTSLHVHSLRDYPDTFEAIVKNMPFVFYDNGNWEESWLDVLSAINNDCKHVRLAPQETNSDLKREVGSLRDTTVVINIEYASPEIRGWTFVEDMPQGWTNASKVSCSRSVVAALKGAGIINMKQPNVNAVDELRQYVDAYRKCRRVEMDAEYHTATTELKDTERAVNTMVGIALINLEIPSVCVGLVTKRVLNHTLRVTGIGVWPDRQVDLLKLIDSAFSGVEQLAGAVGREIGFNPVTLSLPACSVLIAPSLADESPDNLYELLGTAVTAVNHTIAQPAQDPAPDQLRELELSLQNVERCCGLLHDRNGSVTALRLRVSRWLWDCDSKGSRNIAVERLDKRVDPGDWRELEAIAFLAQARSGLGLHDDSAKYAKSAVFAARTKGAAVEEMRLMESNLETAKAALREAKSLFRGDPDIYTGWSDLHALSHRLKVAVFNHRLNPDNALGVDKINCALADWILRCRVVFDHCFWRCLLRTVYLPAGAEAPRTFSLVNLLSPVGLRPYFDPDTDHPVEEEQAEEQRTMRELFDGKLGVPGSPWSEYVAESWAIVTSDWYRLLTALNNRGKHEGFQRVFVYKEPADVCVIANVRDYNKHVNAEEWDLFDYLDTVEAEVDNYARVCADTRAAVYATGVEEVVFESGETRLPTPSGRDEGDFPFPSVM